MKIEIGKRVRYDEANVADDDLEGTVAEPTEEERRAAFAMVNDVMVAWDDGERFWEDPESLVLVEESDE
jgi:hypothetical protein